MDKYRIDSHKLIYHVSRVSDWRAGKIIYPIYMELSPSGGCNHRCTYCGLDFMGYRAKFLDTDILKERLTELGELGLKSAMYAGEGEPFLHKQMAEIICHTKKAGIDVGVTTNAVLMKETITDEILGSAEWIKVSINGATAETYAKIHRTGRDDFDRVIKNMTYAAKVREKNGYKCALGMQLLLLPENHHEAAALAKLASDIGLDYLVIKPYSHHPQSKTQQYKNIKYSDYMYLADELAQFNSERFSVVFRVQAMQKWDNSEHGYERCLALPFWSYIDSEGNVWGCSMYLNDERFLYGNINDQSFEQIWQGQKRLESLRWAREELDASDCRINCRMDKINRYLWELKHPPEHVNFI